MENVPYEMFTSFSATFEDVRRVSHIFYTLRVPRMIQRYFGRFKSHSFWRTGATYARQMGCDPFGSRSESDDIQDLKKVFIIALSNRPGLTTCFSMAAYRNELGVSTSTQLDCDR